MKLVTKAAVAAVLALSTTAVAAENLTIRWGTEAGYKPFMFKTADGELTGFDYDIGQAICEHLEAECTWTEQDWDGLIPGLLSERYDAILASMSITEERQRVVTFAGPYYKIPNRFVGSTDANLDDGDGLSGKVVGVQRGTTGAQYLLSERTDVTVREYPSQEEVWLDLAAGRIDAGFASSIVVNDGFIATQDDGAFEMFGQEYADPAFFGEGTGIALRQEDEEKIEAINGAILALRENGTYATLNDKYFPFDIWGR